MEAPRPENIRCEYNHSVFRDSPYINLCESSLLMAIVCHIQDKDEGFYKVIQPLIDDSQFPMKDAVYESTGQIRFHGVCRSKGLLAGDQYKPAFLD